MRTCEELLKEYLANNYEKKAEKIHFKGVEGKDVYNITAPFKSNDKTIILGRVEPRDSEFSKVCFFENEDSNWCLIEDAPVFDLQDPFYTFINKELIVGGVEVRLKENSTHEMEWKTVFYKGKDIYTLERFFEGPMGMKDLRIAELKDGKIIVVTRPQGEKGGRGKVGYTIVDSLKDLTIEVVDNAPLMKDLFIEEEWGGGNEIHVLNEKLVGILGHIASFDKEGNRHYYPMFITLNIETKEYTEPKLIAIRKEFLESEAKRPDLEDVVFSGGLIRHGDGKAELYAGISDADAQKIEIKDPFYNM
ncbi:DUF1861 family protein [Clostridium sp.]|uniref:DUF1861 family protein n=1 Tax=Clostridium sp. TaxID=1506 RepID=UPI00346477B3